MKSLKAAAVIAGSLIASAAATPAFAHNAADLAPANLNGLHVLEKVTVADVPVPHPTDQLDPENKNSLLHTVQEVTTALNDARQLRGLPLQG
ncbi:hypothetical protein [Streptomyces lomondensis]|uniref:Secreted protein n=1 Tax=Streptomyces lomondensis TaxID=68229 RepID=A0ABQ2WVS4_9ACTN|nr:hypothetical protein [Streptomyces lomondensis]MCF0078697.1 hypothetical protein [Streptomyces lomondensis]GGW79382.1 hypothetical protein GCM10010383_03660 [Streptomyces lomondensis]